MRCMSRKRSGRRPPLDDTIARFERDLQRLALDLARTEINRLRTIPLVASGVRAVHVPAMAATGPRAVRSARRKRKTPAAPPAATFAPAPAAISAPVPMVDHTKPGISPPVPKVEHPPAVTETRTAARRRAAEPASATTEPAEEAVATAPTSQTAIAAPAPIGRTPATVGSSSAAAGSILGAAPRASPPIMVRRSTPEIASADALSAEPVAAAVPAVPEAPPAAAARRSERALVQEPLDARQERVRRRREERAERRRQRRERARQRRAAVVVRSAPVVPEGSRSPEAKPEAAGGAAMGVPAVPRATTNAA